MKLSRAQLLMAVLLAVAIAGQAAGMDATVTETPSSITGVHLRQLAEAAAPEPAGAPDSSQSQPPDASPPSGGGNASDKTSLPPSSSPQPTDPTAGLKVRWCTISANEQAFCDEVVPLLSVRGEQEWSCVQRDSPSACIDAIGQGAAELISLEAGAAFHAFINHSMKAIMAERIDRGLEYDAVIVVRKGLCSVNADLRLVDTKGMRSCHGTYFSAAGWSLPLLTLHSSGIVAVPDAARLAKKGAPSVDIQMMQAFYQTSCAPGDEASRRVCSACLEEGGAAGACDDSDPFYGPVGSFKCLMDNAGDVAFTRTPIVTKYSRGGLLEQDWSTDSTYDFSFLCPAGGCIDITDNPSAFNCTLGKVATNVIMTRNAIAERDKLAIIKRLQEAGAMAAWATALYESANPNEYLLSSSCVGLVAVEKLTRGQLGLAGIAADAVRLLAFENTTSSNHSSTSGAGHLHRQQQPILFTVSFVVGIILCTLV